MARISFLCEQYWSHVLIPGENYQELYFVSLVTQLHYVFVSQCDFLTFSLSYVPFIVKPLVTEVLGHSPPLSDDRKLVRGGGFWRYSTVRQAVLTDNTGPLTSPPHLDCFHHLSAASLDKTSSPSRAVQQEEFYSTYASSPTPCKDPVTPAFKDLHTNHFTFRDLSINR